MYKARCQAITCSGLLHAGCTHFIIGRDMAGCKSSITGEDFYGPYQAQDTAKAHAAELGVQAVPSLNITYTEARPACSHAPWHPGVCRLKVTDFEPHSSYANCVSVPVATLYSYAVAATCTGLSQAWERVPL